MERGRESGAAQSQSFADWFYKRIRARARPEIATGRRIRGQGCAPSTERTGVRVEFNVLEPHARSIGGAANTGLEKGGFRAKMARPGRWEAATGLDASQRANRGITG